MRFLLMYFVRIATPESGRWPFEGNKDKSMRGVRTRTERSTNDAEEELATDVSDNAEESLSRLGRYVSGTVVVWGVLPMI